MRVEDLFGESELARGSEYAADFAETTEQLLVRRGSRGNVDVTGTRNRCGGCEASCLCREAGSEEVRLLQSVFHIISAHVG